MNLTFQDVRPLVGGQLVDADGSKVGTIEDIYLDNETQRPEWALVHTGLLGRKLSYVPLTGASPSDGKLKAGFKESQIKAAPSVDPDGELTPDEEGTLYQHYGVGQDESQAGAPNTDDAMTRSEEELQVGMVRRPSSLVRLKKHVVTENVQATVPVQREKLQVEREPITDANVDQAMAGPELSEDEHELTLNEEQVVVDKQVVPKERVRIDKATETSEEQVSEQLRKERVDMERKR
jgi:uncharacterized protein (TIGR02271 family)